MITTMLILFVVGYAFIAFEHKTGINKSAIALLMCGILWSIFSLEYPSALPGLTQTTVSDEILRHLGSTCEILVFLIGAMTIVDLIDFHGGFEFITRRITTRRKVRLLWLVALLTFFMSALLDNMTTTIIMVMLLRKIVPTTKERMLFASVIVIAANSGGAWSPIGDVTTIMLWVRGNISTSATIPHLFLPSLVSALVPVLIISRYLHGKVTPPNAFEENRDNLLLKVLKANEKLAILCIGVFCLLFVPCLAAQAETYRVEDIPNVQRADRTRYVSNPDGILSDEAVAHIDRLCAALRERAVAQVAVVAVDDIAGGDVFDFAIDLFSAWGVGQARNDNGLGILLVKDRREIRFVTGGGLEGVLPDAICKRIQLKYMLPAFRQGDYSLGMVQGVEAVSQLLEGSELDLGGTDTAGDELPAWAVFLIVTGFVVVPMGVILLGYYARKRCPKCHKLTLRQQSSDILKVTPNYRLVEYTYVCSNCGAVVKRQAKNLRDDNFGGGAGGGMIIGGRGFGGFGGGSRGGGFGGGSFGGGGAGARW